MLALRLLLLLLLLASVLCYGVFLLRGAVVWRTRSLRLFAAALLMLLVFVLVLVVEALWYGG